MYRLSFTFSICKSCGGGGCWAASTVASAPTTTSTPSTALRFITLLLSEIPVRQTSTLPASTTTTDPAIASRSPRTALLRRISSSSHATTRTMASCPISTPRLNENSDQPSAAAGSPNSFNTAAKPNPCTRPNTAAIMGRISRGFAGPPSFPGFRVAGPRLTSRLSAPTKTMLKAIAGSTMCPGGEKMSSAASDSVMLCPMVNAVTMAASRRQRSAEEQETDRRRARDRGRSGCARSPPARRCE